jgi:two-component system, LuxR family, response regulator FixJ
MDLLRRFIELKQAIPFIMLTAVGTIELAVEATQLGSANFLQKGRPAGELIAAIQKAVQNPPLAINERLQAQKKLALLTPREHEVFLLIADGLTSKQMARLLNISDRTIETHRANLTDKLGIQSPAQLNELRRKAE